MKRLFLTNHRIQFAVSGAGGAETPPPAQGTTPAGDGQGSSGQVQGGDGADQGGQTQQTSQNAPDEMAGAQANDGADDGNWFDQQQGSDLDSNPFAEERPQTLTADDDGDAKTFKEFDEALQKAQEGNKKNPDKDTVQKQEKLAKAAEAMEQGIEATDKQDEFRKEDKERKDQKENRQQRQETRQAVDQTADRREARRRVQEGGRLAEQQRQAALANGQKKLAGRLEKVVDRYRRIEERLKTAENKFEQKRLEQLGRQNLSKYNRLVQKAVHRQADVKQLSGEERRALQKDVLGTGAEEGVGEFNRRERKRIRKEFRAELKKAETKAEKEQLKEERKQLLSELKQKAAKRTYDQDKAADKTQDATDQAHEQVEHDRLNPSLEHMRSVVEKLQEHELLTEKQARELTQKLADKQAMTMIYGAGIMACPEDEDALKSQLEACQAEIIGIDGETGDTEFMEITPENEGDFYGYRRLRLSSFEYLKNKREEGFLEGTNLSSVATFEGDRLEGQDQFRFLESKKEQEVRPDNRYGRMFTGWYSRRGSDEVYAGDFHATLLDSMPS